MAAAATSSAEAASVLEKLAREEEIDLQGLFEALYEADQQHGPSGALNWEVLNDIITRFICLTCNCDFDYVAAPWCSELYTDVRAQIGDTLVGEQVAVPKLRMYRLMRIVSDHLGLNFSPLEVLKRGKPTSKKLRLTAQEFSELKVGFMRMFQLALEFQQLKETINSEYFGSRVTDLMELEMDVREKIPASPAGTGDSLEQLLNQIKDTNAEHETLKQRKHILQAELNKMLSDQSRTKLREAVAEYESLVKELEASANTMKANIGNLRARQQKVNIPTLAHLQSTYKTLESSSELLGNEAAKLAAENEQLEQAIERLEQHDLKGFELTRLVRIDLQDAWSSYKEGTDTLLQKQLMLTSRLSEISVQQGSRQTVKTGLTEEIERDLRAVKIQREQLDLLQDSVKSERIRRGLNDRKTTLTREIDVLKDKYAATRQETRSISTISTAAEPTLDELIVSLSAARDALQTKKDKYGEVNANSLIQAINELT